MVTINDILLKFDPITLKEMDSVKLMNRTDTKYVFKTEQLPGFLDEVKDNYFVLDVNGVRASRYKTLYFDTDDFRLYMAHQNGKLNRNKVRYRSYVDSCLNYFEIKFKSNKERTLKDRIKRPEITEEITGKAKDFLQSKTEFAAENLKPKLWVNYTRITLVNKTSEERLTIDMDLHYLNDHKEKKLPEIVIAELKQGKRANTAFVEVMREHRIKTASISKYCFGVIFLYENIKMNNFKSKLLTLNKICYDTL